MYRAATVRERVPAAINQSMGDPLAHARGSEPFSFAGKAAPDLHPPIAKQNGGIMSASIGRRRWAIAEGYIPAWSKGPEPEMTSHETACLLNVGDQDAHVEITIFFNDREPAGPYRLTVPARRTKHLRFNNLSDPEPIPRGTDYASLLESDVPIVVQHTRLDSRQESNALITTIAFAE